MHSSRSVLLNIKLNYDRIGGHSTASVYFSNISINGKIVITYSIIIAFVHFSSVIKKGGDN